MSSYLHRRNCKNHNQYFQKGHIPAEYSWGNNEGPIYNKKSKKYLFDKGKSR